MNDEKYNEIKTILKKAPGKYVRNLTNDDIQSYSDKLLSDIGVATDDLYDFRTYLEYSKNGEDLFPKIDKLVVTRLFQQLGLHGDVGDLQPENIENVLSTKTSYTDIWDFEVAKIYLEKSGDNSNFANTIKPYVERYFTFTLDRINAQLRTETEETTKGQLLHYLELIKKNIIPVETHTYEEWFTVKYNHGINDIRFEFVPKLRKTKLTLQQWESDKVDESEFDSFIQTIHTKRSRSYGAVAMIEETFTNKTIKDILSGKKTYFEWSNSNKVSIKKNLRHKKAINHTSHDTWYETYVTEDEFNREVEKLFQDADVAKVQRTYVGNDILNILQDSKPLQEWFQQEYPDNFTVNYILTPKSWSNVTIKSNDPHFSDIHITKFKFSRTDVPYETFISVVEKLEQNSTHTELPTAYTVEALKYTLRQVRMYSSDDHETERTNDSEEDEDDCELFFVRVDKWIKEYRGSLYPLLNQAINVYEENVSESLLESDIVNWLHNTHCPLGTLLQNLFADC